MKAWRAYIAGLGASGVLIASFLLVLVVGSAFVAFNGFPGHASNDGLDGLEVTGESRPAGSGVDDRAAARKQRASARATAERRARSGVGGVRLRGSRRGLAAERIGSAPAGQDGAPGAAGDGAGLPGLAPEGGRLPAPKARDVTGGLGDAVEDVTGPVGEQVGRSAPALGETVTDTGDTVGGVLDDTGPTVDETVGGVTEGVGGATEGVGGATEGVGGTVDDVGGAAGDAVGGLNDTAGGAVGGLTGGG